VTVPFVIMLALGQIVFAYNLIQTLRGRRRAARENLLASLGLTASLVAGAALLAGTAFALNHKRAGQTPATPALGAAGGGTANLGAQLFSSSCGSCHTLNTANTNGTVGPNLDQVKPNVSRVLSAIKNGGLGSGTMPKGLYQGAEAQAIAQFVAGAAGK
jgi:mono/diheme cytochrome c family protein